MAVFNFFATPATANGDSALYQGFGLDVFRRNSLSIFVTGTFASATVTAYGTVDGVNWLPVATAITAPGIININSSATAIKLSVTGATGTTSIIAASSV